MSLPLISVVVPLFNEEENIQHLFDRCSKALDVWTNNYEIICVNDGSKDKTLALRHLQKDESVIANVVENTNQNTFETKIFDSVYKAVIVYLKVFLSYNILGKNFYCHIVNHRAKEYVYGMTYKIEIKSFWNDFKRGIENFYSWVYRNLLQYYAIEYTFRFNTRNFIVPNSLDFVLCGSLSKMLTINRLTNE